MKNFAWIAASLTLVACGDKDGTDDTGGVGSGGEPACEITVDSTFPTDGSTDHYFLSDVEFELSDSDSTASLTVTDASGAAVAGSAWLNDDADVIYFTADGGLTSSTAYTATASLCGGELSPAISFTTSELGTARDCEIEGNAYVVDLTQARILEPAGVGDLLLSQLENNILMGVAADNDTSIDILGAISVAGSSEQDYCTESIDFSDVDFTADPSFQAGPKDTTLTVAGFSIPIGSLLVSGTFAPDCSYFGGGQLSGELDARELAPLVKDLLDTDDPDEICELLVGFGVACAACSLDGEEYCLTIKADSIVADLHTDSVECVAEGDCHPSCAENSEECNTEDYPTCE